jgi:transposase
MMGRQTGDQSQLFYLFNLERRIPAGHLLRRINPVVTRILIELRGKLIPFYSDIGRPSIDPELMIRMLIVGIRFERRLCEEVELHMAYRWFCRLDLDDRCPITRHSRSIATAVSATVISCAKSLKRFRLTRNHNGRPQFTFHGCDIENSCLRGSNHVLCGYGSGYREEGSVSLRVWPLLADRCRVWLPIRLPAPHEMGTEGVLSSRSG